MRDADGRGPRTALTPLVLEHFVAGAARAAGRGDLRPRAGPARDRVARRRSSSARAPTAMPSPREILRDAADELALAAASVVSRLDMRGDQFPTCSSGGMFERRAVAGRRSDAPPGRSRAAQRRRAARRRARDRRRAAGARRGARRRARAAVSRRRSSTAGSVIIRTLRSTKMRWPSALASRLLDAIVAQPALVLGLPTGRTPLALYRELRERSRAGARRLVAGAHVQPRRVRRPRRRRSGSYRAFMQAALFDHVAHRSGATSALLERPRARPGGRVRALRARRSRRPAASTSRSSGIGANGHIGFNEPADALHAHTHVATLQPSHARGERAAVRRRPRPGADARAVDGHGDDPRRARRSC